MKNSLNANHKKWYVIDAKGKTLGKLATIIATILNGKHKSINNPSLDCGDYVIVINSKDIKIVFLSTFIYTPLHNITTQIQKR